MLASLRIFRLCHISNCIRNQKLTILGIESSCDDTGVAIINDKKELLGEALHSQGKMHRGFGGIIATIACHLHAENINRLVLQVFEQAKLGIQDIDGVAVTVKPGLRLSLLVGLNHAKEIALAAGKPIIPIHHMEAHALTARLTHNIDFPYLVMLMSGGHCLLAVVEGVTKFKLLGTSIDSSPGDMLDKTARRLKLKSLQSLDDLSGGAAIEKLAVNGDPHRFAFPDVMHHIRDCNFSFAGLQSYSKRIIEAEEERLGVSAGSVIPTVADLCAAVQHATLSHMATRLYRAFLFCDMEEMLPRANRVLVLSGGVASNFYIREGLSRVARQFDCETVCPPPRLCTDNGSMIAWNGVEKMINNIDVSSHADLTVEHRSPLGECLIARVANASLKVAKLKLDYVSAAAVIK